MKRMILLLRTGILCLSLFCCAFKGFAQSETLPSGAFIINMGVTPQTINNGIRPYGLIWDLIKNNKVQVKWVISQTKAKDGIDFTYNSIDYKGGTFIIPQKYISAAVLAKINAVWPSIIVGAFTTTPLTVNVNYTLKYTPKWTFDFQNGSIAQGYLTNANIPITDYPKKDPDQLNGCDDLFVMPHADPTWATHQNLYFWNLSNQGWIWAGCHAVSVMENLYNPLDSTQQMDFLSKHFDGYGLDHDANATIAGNSLVMYNQHTGPGNTYTYAYPNDAEMQFMGGVENGVGANGSEQCFMPYNANTSGDAGKVSTWRFTTKLAVTDMAPAASNQNVPENSNGPVGEVMYGRAFGDNARGEVLYEAGHNHDGSSPGFVAAQRIFFNFSFLSVYDKDPLAVTTGPTTIAAGASGNFSVNVIKPGANINDYYINWTSSCGGTFSSPHGINTTYTPQGGAGCGPCVLTVTVTDGCGREFYSTVDLTVTVCPVPPVALDRTANMISNPPGTGPQTIGAITPLDGTDMDGVVVSYTITSIPSATAGKLYYDNDGNAGTADILLPVNTVLTATQANSIKFDPADGYGADASFTYTVTDNTGLTDATPATYTIPVNPPPVAADILTAPINTNTGSVLISPALNATDDGSIISYTITVLPTAAQGVLKLYNVPVAVNQVLTPAQAAQLTFLPTGTFVGYPTFTYSATDNRGGIDATPATVTIQLVNQAPVANSISNPKLLNPNGTGATTITGLSATDADGIITSYTVLSLPSVTQGVLYYKNGNLNVEVAVGQLLTPTQAANLKFDPVDGYTGNVTFQYTATDNNGLAASTPATYNIPVNIVPPVTTDINNPAIYSGALATTLSSLNGADPDATKIINFYTIVTVPDITFGSLSYVHNGTVTPLTAGTVVMPAEKNTLKFDPKDGATGNAVFLYTCTDNELLTDQTPATFTIPITNAAPATTNVTNPAIGSNAGATTLSAIRATDADGTIANYTIISLNDPALGTLKLNGTPVYCGQVILPAQANALQFTPIPGSSGSAVFKYTSTDDQGATDATAANFTIPITLFNTAPTADTKTNPAMVINQGATSILPLTGTDAGGTIVSYSVSHLPGAANGTVFLYGVPVTNNQVIPVNMADKLSFKPSGTFSGNATFKYSATDDMGSSSPDAVFTIPVNNTAPTAQNITMTQVKKSQTISIYPLSATDVDGTIASYKILSLPTLTTATLYVDLTGTAVYSPVTVNQTLTPAAASRLRVITGNVIGNTSFTYTATDNNARASTAATYTIPVTSNTTDPMPPYVNNIINGGISSTAGTTAISSLTATDLDGTIAGYMILTIPPPYAGYLSFMKGGTTLTQVQIGGTALTTTEAATLKFTPTGAFIGNISFKYYAVDNTNMASNNGVYTIPLINNPPVSTNISNASIASNAGPTLLSSLAATDADGTVTGYTIISLPATGQGILSVDGVPVSEGQTFTPVTAGRIKFDPNSNFTGNATFMFTSTDNLGNSSTNSATFTIPVTNVAPFADDKVSQVITNNIGTGPLSIPGFTGSDLDGSISSYTIKTLPTGGVLYVNGTAATVNQSVNLPNADKLTFDPTDGFAGTALFTYASKDNSALTSVVAANYSIKVNTPPVANNITTAAVYPNSASALISPLTGTDDGSIQFFTINSLPATVDGILSLAGTPVTDLSQVDTLTTAQAALLQFTPGTGFKGTSFTYTATDNIGLIDVTPANYTIPAKISAAGKVWNDVNGNVSTDGTETSVNGTNSGNGITTGAPLYVNLIDANGLVSAWTAVQADGNYSFATLTPFTKYTLQLTTVKGTVGLAKPATTLPTGWATTGENKNNIAGFADATPNSEIILNTDNTIITSQEFGIEKLPESALTSHSGGVNPGNFATTSVDPTYFVTSNVGSNANTLDYHAGTVNNIRIVSFPTNTNTISINNILYINGGTCPVFGTCTNWPAQGVTTAFADGAGPVQPILLDPVDGAVTVRIPFAAIDNAGKEDPTPGYAELVYTLTVVPVRIIDFAAVAQGKDVKLNWVVNRELNVDRYEAEFAPDGNTFSRIGSMTATGNSNYELLHTSPVKGMNYYRLKIFDRDGSFVYSNIIRVRMDGTDELSASVRPNPFTTEVNVTLDLDHNTTVQFALFDNSGKLVYQKKENGTKGKNTFNLFDMESLPPGTYFLKIITDTKSSSQKLMKL